MESYDLTCLRVKLVKAGWNHSDIDQLLNGVYDINEVKSLKRIVDTCYELINGLTCGNATTLGLIKGLVNIFAENANTEHISQINVSANKNDFGNWIFTVGVE